MRTFLPMNKGQAVRTLREVAGLTGRETAQAAGVSESYLSRVETGAAEASPEWIGTVVASIAESIRRRALDSPRAERAELAEEAA